MLNSLYTAWQNPAEHPTNFLQNEPNYGLTPLPMTPLPKMHVHAQFDRLGFVRREFGETTRRR